MDAVANSTLVDALARIVGREFVLDQPEARSRYAHDQWWYAIAAAAAGEPISRPDVAVQRRAGRSKCGSRRHCR
jgi:hypothetical protein